MEDGNKMEMEVDEQHQERHDREVIIGIRGARLG